MSFWRVRTVTFVVGLFPQNNLEKDLIIIAKSLMVQNQSMVKWNTVSDLALLSARARHPSRGHQGVLVLLSGEERKKTELNFQFS